jgi:L-2-hydroxyglutarate oxidase LhgO
MSSAHCDVLIVGGGMVGLCLAYQLLERGIAGTITVLDKEPELGRHSSGRNSGVLHAGLYYKPGSIKAQVCVGGARRLRAWVEERGLPLNSCGKVIVPPRPELDGQLDVLAERGTANGATVEFWDETQLRELIPEARSASGRALWSANCSRSCRSGASPFSQAGRAGRPSRSAASCAWLMGARSSMAI